MKISNLLMVGGLNPLSIAITLSIIAIIYFILKSFPDNLLVRIEKMAEKEKDIVTVKQKYKGINSEILFVLTICHKPVDKNMTIVFVSVVDISYQEYLLSSPVVNEQKLKEILPELPYKESEPERFILRNEMISEKSIKYLFENARINSEKYLSFKSK